MTSNATTELLTLDAVAAELSVSKTSVEAWVRDKHLASFKKGRCLRVSREDLTKFVLANTRNPKRPDWLTAPVESDFRNLMRAIVKQEVEQVTWLEQQRQATEQRRQVAGDQQKAAA
jgi:excisionase family DNA binding protein